MELDRPRIYVNFNELVERDLVLLSRGDSCLDSSGATIQLSEGLRVFIYDDDNQDEEGNPDPMLATGRVERHDANWAKQVKWACRIDGPGVVYLSDLSEREGSE